MSLDSYLHKKKELQKCLLEYIENEDDEENYQNIVSIINQEIEDDQYELEQFLNLINRVSKNHYRTENFFNKIEKILIETREKTCEYLSNARIFEIFKRNKRILLFLFEEKILIPDDSIIKQITVMQMYKKYEYFQYFYPELKEYLTETKQLDINEYEDFEKNRKEGQNNHYICQLIRKDLIDDFISYVKKYDISLSIQIKRSIYETNSFLMKNDVTLIEYAGFFGATQIFKYLYLNKVKINPSIWLYAIHSQNYELFNYLETNDIKTNDISFNECLKEAIKCHHNEMAEYIMNNKKSGNQSKISIKYHNYCFFPKKLCENLTFLNLCKHNYVHIVEVLLQKEHLNINTKTIFLFF